MPCLCGSAECRCHDDCFCFPTECECRRCEPLPKTCRRCDLPFYLEQEDDLKREFCCCFLQEVTRAAPYNLLPEIAKGKQPGSHTIKNQNAPQKAIEHESLYPSDHRKETASMQGKKLLAKLYTEKSTREIKKTKEKRSDLDEFCGKEQEKPELVTETSNICPLESNVEQNVIFVDSPSASKSHRNIRNMNPHSSPQTPASLHSRTDNASTIHSTAVNTAGSSPFSPENLSRLEYRSKHSNPHSSTQTPTSLHCRIDNSTVNSTAVNTAGSCPFYPIDTYQHLYRDPPYGIPMRDPLTGCYRFVTSEELNQGIRPTIPPPFIRLPTPTQRPVIQSPFGCHFGPRGFLMNHPLHSLPTINLQEKMFKWFQSIENARNAGGLVSPEQADSSLSLPPLSTDDEELLEQQSRAKLAQPLEQPVEGLAAQAKYSSNVRKASSSKSQADFKKKSKRKEVRSSKV